MNAKMLILLLVGASFLFFGCAKQEGPPGSDRDAHGCIPSAGYSWCEVKQKCLRTWEEPCIAGSITLDEARAIALNSQCMIEGNITSEYSYNNVTHTWWFETDIVKQGCSPACVVYESSRTAEINWRCTGLIIPENETAEEETPEENETGGTTGTAVDEQTLADLFQIETDEPFGTEGLDTQTPSAQSNSS